eukprot:CAMPEP_0173416308 /NCGR_PEP_ID=MMETSP1356-20130122/85321_1 /TAXON_ID=77927 ORGANISM="Hemiselmis virescens, Strain PCC157" /NCGR_SAMPLE_ID=MMETSP1356 /ASSEMBLY_ACC=CAM_ASM_000847 /LENGTH=344 /DNA_ID=CAMNT_0014378615 /DNA_START=17 /DNA_END=1052 /DNA_ORIENTATION=-
MAMEKRFLTYRARTLRPHGGVDPTVSQLKKDAMENTVLGFTLEDGDAAGRLYNYSKHSSEEAELRTRKQKEWLVKEEKQRQQEERSMLKRSLGLRVKGFEGSVKTEHAVTEQHCEKKLKDAQEKAEAERQILERKLERERVLPVKFSPGVRDEIECGKKFAKAQKYDLINKMHKKLEKEKSEEREAWFQELQKRKEIAKRNLEARLQKDIEAVEEKVAVIKNTFDKRVHKQRNQLQLNCGNLLTDVERAFKREWNARPEVAVSAKYSNKSRNSTSMTFLGSLLVDRQVGGKYDLPSLSQVHFEGEALSGTKKDQDVTEKMDFYAILERQNKSQKKEPMQQACLL